jgi:hypothetical protein
MNVSNGPESRLQQMQDIATLDGWTWTPHALHATTDADPEVKHEKATQVASREVVIF